LLLEIASDLVHSHVCFQVIEAKIVAAFPSTVELEPVVIFLLLPAIREKQQHRSEDCTAIAIKSLL
jgi:hypothetical protein